MLGIMSVLRAIDTSHLEYLGWIQFISFTCLVILTVFGIFLIVSFRKSSKKTGAIIGTIMLLLTPVCVGGLLWASMEIDEWYGVPSASYTLTLEPVTDEVSVVYVPVPEDKHVRSRIKVLSGDATIALQDQVRGKALKVTFSGTVSVVANVDSEEGFTGTLTMKEEIEDSGREDYWISYHPPTDADGNCSFSIRYSIEGGLGGGPTYRCEGYLEDGWNLYPGEYYRVAV